MVATKTSCTLLTSQSLAAATSINATTELNLSTAYGALVTVKLTNGASAPTTAPTVTVYVGEATGVKRKFYQVAGDTVASSVNDFVCEIPAPGMFVNVTILNGATNAITVEAYAQELTTI
jgi:hypothetical protein